MKQLEDLRPCRGPVFMKFVGGVASQLQTGVKNVKPGLCPTLIARNFCLTLMNTPGEEIAVVKSNGRKSCVYERQKNIESGVLSGCSPAFPGGEKGQYLSCKFNFN